MNIVQAIQGLFGLLLGSFANVVIYRVPLGQSIIAPPSHCTSCGQNLSPLENVPVISYVALMGRCKHCKAKISPRYPIIEIACAALFALVSWRLCMFAFFLLCISVIDYETQTIPDGLVIGLGISGLLNITSISSVLDALLGAFIGASVIFLIDRAAIVFIKKDGFGFGDVKLMAAIGLGLGSKLVVMTLFFGFIIGGIVGVIVKLKNKEQAYMAFGPCLAAAAMFAIWFGLPLINRYIELLKWSQI